MSIVLEPVVDQAEVETVATPPETAAPEVEAAPEPVVEAAPEPVDQAAAEPTTPAPKKRGRPRKDITPAKVAPQSSSQSSA